MTEINGTLIIDVEMNNAGFEKGLEEQNASLHSQVAKRAAIYRKEGISLSDAMTKAWSDIKKEQNSAMDNLQKKSDETSGNLTKIFSKISDSFKNVAKSIGKELGVESLSDLGEQALDLAKELETVEKSMSASFGELSYMVENFAATSAENFGMSELDAKKTATEYMNMSKSIGISANESANMALNAAKRMGDVASYYGITQAEAEKAMSAIWTGEAEGLNAIGIAMDESSLQQFALQNGFNKSISSMTEQEQVMLRYAYVMEQTGLASGDFASSQDSLVNKTTTFKEKFNDLLTSLGETLAPVLTPIVDKLTEFFDNMQEKLAAIGTWIQENETLFTVLATVILSIAAAIGAVSAAYSIYQTVTSIATAVQTLFGASLGISVGWILVIIAAIVAVIAIIALCIIYWDDIKAAALSAWESIKEWWGGVKDWFYNNVVAPVKNFFTNLWNGISTAAVNAWNTVKSAAVNTVNKMLTVVEKFINFFISGINLLISGLNKVKISIPDWIPGIGGKTFGFNISAIPKVEIPKLATGAVIPPNAEFAAILGDQKHGRNLEAPEGLIRQIVREEGGSNLTVILQMPDGSQRKVFDTKSITRANRQSGKVLIPVEV